MTVSILFSHRLKPDFGLRGGLAGSLGQNIVTYYHGKIISLGGCVEVAMQQGDSLIIKTFGGGGWLGNPDKQ